jgi:hypothetical protein
VRLGDFVEMRESTGSVAIAETTVEDKHHRRWLIGFV